MHNEYWLCNIMHISLLVYFAAITVGYVETAVNVSESDGMAKLTVAISIPPKDVPIETSFSLLVNTPTGLLALECEFGLCMYTLVYTYILVKYYMNACTHTHT